MVAGAVFAQEGSRSSRQDRRDEAFRMVDAYVIANIQESLDLDDDQYARIIPLVNKLQKARREYHRERGRTLRQMRQLLKSGAATESQLEEAVASLKTLEVEGPARIRERVDELDSILSPVQQAKYRVFEMDVERRLRDLMRRGRRERTQEGRPRP
jgi:ABC-type transporter Mla subunit MlaD